MRDDRAIVWLSLENGGPGEAKGVGLAMYALDGDTETLVHYEFLSDIAMESQSWMAPMELTPDWFGPDGLGSPLMTTAMAQDGMTNVLKTITIGSSRLGRVTTKGG